MSDSSRRGRGYATAPRLLASGSSGPSHPDSHRDCPGSLWLPRGLLLSAGCSWPVLQKGKRPPSGEDTGGDTAGSDAQGRGGSQASSPHLHRPPGAGRACIRLVPPLERGFLTKGQAWVGQMLLDGKSGVVTEACRAPGGLPLGRAPGSPAASQRAPSAAVSRRHAYACTLPLPCTRSSLWDRWGPVGPSRRGGGAGSGEHSALESQSPCPRGDSGKDRCLPLTLASLPRAPERAP